MKSCGTSARLQSERVSDADVTLTWLSYQMVGVRLARFSTMFDAGLAASYTDSREICTNTNEAGLRPRCMHLVLLILALQGSRGISLSEIARSSGPQELR